MVSGFFGAISFLVAQCGCGDRTRTCDLLHRRQALYPLSYRGSSASLAGFKRPRVTVRCAILVGVACSRTPQEDSMRVHIATDHAGFELKEKIVADLREKGYEAKSKEGRVWRYALLKETIAIFFANSVRSWMLR